MKLPPDQIVVALPPGAFRRWLKSDMRVMRWVFLALYVSIIIVCLWTCLNPPDTQIAIYLAILIASQALFILGSGSIALCRPIRKRRLLLPVITSGLMVALLIGGLTVAMAELFYLDKNDAAGYVYLGSMALSWIGWSVLIFFHVRDLPRYRVISRLANYLLVGSLAELLATAPAHVIVSRRPGCLVGIGTMMGIIAGVSVMLFSFGPMIVLLFLRPRLRAEMKEGNAYCPNCGYDLRATPTRCPECGLQVENW